MSEDFEPVRMYFSFRSPYSWMATERIIKESIPVDPIAYVKAPADTPPPNPITSSAKGAYVARDVVRLAKRLGFNFLLPDPFDVDFSRVNNAFFVAKKHGKGLAFMKAAYRSRFVGGRNIATDDVLADVSLEAGFDPDYALAAADDAGIRNQSLAKMEETLETDRPFGVPFFVFRGEPFWGQDRVDLLLDTVRAAEIQADV
jgi:2-hydroxychromene-2-carboxylate isomerase